ncbi:hypothetical protein GGI12_000314 [Dipsacomyces acuminosporus]|nr:hypothetical protein GGI12_000314 [Dipsacomyces acuminosporus]
MSCITSGFDKEKYALGMAAKQSANEHFKQKDFVKALKDYHTSLLYLLGLQNSPLKNGQVKNPDDVKEEDISDIDKDVSVIYSNMAACQVRLRKTNRTIECANAALKKNPFNKKAKFRLVQGYIAEGSLEKAKKLLDELEKDAPNDPAFKQERQNIATKEKEAKSKQRKELAGMFDRKKPSKD